MESQCFFPHGTMDPLLKLPPSPNFCNSPPRLDTDLFPGMPVLLPPGYSSSSQEDDLLGLRDPEKLRGVMDLAISKLDNDKSSQGGRLLLSNALCAQLQPVRLPTSLRYAPPPPNQQPPLTASPRDICPLFIQKPLQNFNLRGGETSTSDFDLELFQRNRALEFNSSFGTSENYRALNNSTYESTPTYAPPDFLGNFAGLGVDEAVNPTVVSQRPQKPQKRRRRRVTDGLNKKESANNADYPTKNTEYVGYSAGDVDYLGGRGIASTSSRPQGQTLRASTTSFRKQATSPRKARVAAAVAAAPTTNSAVPHKRGKEDYDRGSCTCQTQYCDSCKRTCFYEYHRGRRAGQVCMRIFPNERLADLDRHKVSHAATEWFWYEFLEILTLDQVPWYEKRPNATGYFCPNGGPLKLVPDVNGKVGLSEEEQESFLNTCTANFTRGDALRRHMLGSCKFKAKEQTNTKPTGMRNSEHANATPVQTLAIEDDVVPCGKQVNCEECSGESGSSLAVSNVIKEASLKRANELKPLVIQLLEDDNAGRKIPYEYKSLLKTFKKVRDGK